MGLKTYLAKRLAYTVVLTFFVLTLNFIIFEALPGQNSVIESLIGSGHRTTPGQIAALKHLYGLDKPLYVRYGIYIYNMATLKFGISIRTGDPVLSDLVRFLPNTLILLGIATTLSVVLGIGVGMLAAYKRGGILDTTSVVASLTTFSLPVFWMGLLFLLVFSYYLGWLPPGGNQPDVWAINPPTNIFTIFFTKMEYAFLPVLTLTLFLYGGYVLLTRATMLESLTEDYITTARAKGVSERTIIVKHAFKNASLPLVTSVALAFGTILAGAIITETVFRWPGIGFWTFQSIQFQDLPVLQTIFYLGALAIIFANLGADIIYGLIDPRIKYS
jgi:peptide/nickel transport system permease protein